MWFFKPKRCLVTCPHHQKVKNGGMMKKGHFEWYLKLGTYSVCTAISGTNLTLSKCSSRKTQYPIPPTLSCFSETPENSGVQIYGLEALNSETEEVIGSERRFSPTNMKFSHSLEPYSKRQCFTYFSRNLGGDKRESTGTEDSFNSRFGNEEIRDQGCIRACHICRRKSSQKNETEFYSTCESCHKSACYICLRRCTGKEMASNEGRESQILNSKFSPSEHVTASKLNTHYERICSHCCVEQNTDGEVRCLGCLNQIVWKKTRKKSSKG